MKRLAFFIVITVIILALVSILFVQRLSNDNPQILNFPGLNIFQRDAVSNNLNITSVDFTNPQTKMYKVVGMFSQPLYVQNDWLMGEFQVAGDSNQTQIRVLLVSSGAVVELGEVVETNVVEFTPVSLEQAQQKIPTGQLIELRFVYEMGSDGEYIQKQQQEMLEALTKDTSIEVNEYTLFPHMVSLGGLDVL